MTVASCREPRSGVADRDSPQTTRDRPGEPGKPGGRADAGRTARDDDVDRTQSVQVTGGDP